MVAGRSLSLTMMVFTLVCTWIGSGTFIAGAEYASYAGLERHLAAGRGLPRHRDHLLHRGQDPDVRPVHGRRHPRGALRPVRPALRRDRADHRLHDDRRLPVPGGRLHPQRGQRRPDLARDRPDRSPAAFVILFVAIGGMVAVAHTDLPNGIIIVSACLLAVPFVVAAAGRLGARPRGARPGEVPGVRLGLRQVPGAQGLRLLPLDAAPADGRAVDVPEVLRRPLAEGSQAGRGDLDRRHHRRRDDRHRDRRLRVGLQRWSTGSAGTAARWCSTPRDTWCPGRSACCCSARPARWCSRRA